MFENNYSVNYLFVTCYTFFYPALPQSGPVLYICNVLYLVIPCVASVWRLFKAALIILHCTMLYNMVHYIHMYTYIYIYIHTCISMYTRTYIYIYIYAVASESAGPLRKNVREGSCQTHFQGLKCVICHW